MNKQETYEFLKRNGVPFEVYEHPAVYTVEEAAALNLPHAEAGAKNLFVRDGKKQHYLLITMKDDKPMKLKDFEAEHGFKHLSFASEEDLMKYLQVIRGSVTPMGLFNDSERKVHFFLDSYYKGRIVSAHPNENTATIFLEADRLMELIREHGNEAEYFDI